MNWLEWDPQYYAEKHKIIIKKIFTHTTNIHTHVEDVTRAQDKKKLPNRAIDARKLMQIKSNVPAQSKEEEEDMGEICNWQTAANGNDSSPNCLDELRAGRGIPISSVARYVKHIIYEF